MKIVGTNVVPDMLVKMSKQSHVAGDRKFLPQSQPMVLVSSWSPASLTLTAFAKDIFQLQTYK